jgi:protein-S-isoprenylcysteine O-methyltransferase Ste14
MYGATGPSRAQRVTLAALLGGCAGFAWWLLFDSGIGSIGVLFGRQWMAANTLRCAALGAAFAIYFVRVLFTEFVFLKRGMSWAEVFTIGPWVFVLYLFLGIAGGSNAAGFGGVAIAGAALFVIGSWTNSFAEYERHAWKKRPENKGKLYTLGLFRYSRHPNYLGDLISFSGICMMTGRWFTAIVPVLMLCGFVFVNVPALDEHLKEHYGPAFDEYALRARKLIPFVY